MSIARLYTWSGVLNSLGVFLTATQPSLVGLILCTLGSAAFVVAAFRALKA